MTGQYVKISVHYDEDDRVIDAGPLAELVHQRSLRLSARLLSDGFVTARQVERLVSDLGPLAANTADPISSLLRVGLWTVDNDDPDRPGYRIRRWDKWNESAQLIAQVAQSRRDGAARRQADKRARDKAKAAQEVTGESRVTSQVTERESRTSSSSSSSTSTTSSNSSSSTTDEPPPLRDGDTKTLLDLAEAITSAGLLVSWNIDARDRGRILTAADRCGVKALTDHAKRRHRPDSPAFSVRAWIDEWERLPALRLVSTSKLTPCPEHPYLTPARVCSACASDAKAGDA